MVGLNGPLSAMQERWTKAVSDVNKSDSRERHTDRGRCRENIPAVSPDGLIGLIDK